MKKPFFLFLIFYASPLFPILDASVAPVWIPVSYSKLFWSLIGPVKSIDSEAELWLDFWHDKEEHGKYRRDENHQLDIGCTAKEFREAFPEKYIYSVRDLSKLLLLRQHNRLKFRPLTKRFHSGSSDPYDYNFDYEYEWNKEPIKNRFWWTVRYRRPYTYFLSLGKWAAEGALAVGAIKGALALKKWYQKGVKDTLHISG